MTGLGTAANPYVVSANVEVDCDDVRPCISVADTPTMNFTYDPVTGIISGAPIISPDAGNTLTAPNGLFVPTPVATVIQPLDTITVDTVITGTGTPGDPYIISGNVLTDEDRATTIGPNGVGVCLSVDAGNAIIFGTDGCLFVPAGGVTVLDTETVDLTLTGTQIEADVIIDPDPANIISQTTTNGLIATLVTDVCGFTGSGTAVDPLALNTGAWPYPCDESNGETIYCNAATGQLIGPPPKGGVATSSSGGATPGTTPVPQGPAFTTVDTATITLVNPDPCREAHALIVWEGDVTFDIAPGSQVDMGMNGDGMFQLSNPDAVNVQRVAIQQARGVIQAVIAPGGVFNFSDPIQIRETVGNGSTYNRTQWRVNAIVAS